VIERRPKFLVLADGDFGPMTSKTANSIIRFRTANCVAVLDREHAGTTAHDVLGFGGALPVVASMRDGLALGADTVLIGLAPMGGRMPADWHAWLLEAVQAGCDVWNGLHVFLNDDPALAEAARISGAVLHDLRRPPADLTIASGKARELHAFVVLTVGTDCNVGKMTGQLQLVDDLKAQGIRTRFVATGQTGIMIEGWGIAVDAVVADFVAGAAERLTLEGAEGAEVVLVEGQGSINHPGYSGVTLGLLHGSCPSAMILCHQATRTHIGDYRDNAGLKIPPLGDYVRLYELLGNAVHPTRVIAISLNTYDLNEVEAHEACAAATAATGLPCTDPVRFGPAVLTRAVQEAQALWQSRRNARD